MGGLMGEGLPRMGEALGSPRSTAKKHTRVGLKDCRVGMQQAQGGCCVTLGRVRTGTEPTGRSHGPVTTHQTIGSPSAFPNWNSESRGMPLHAGHSRLRPVFTL